MRASLLYGQTTREEKYQQHTKAQAQGHHHMVMSSQLLARGILGTVN